MQLLSTKRLTNALRSGFERCRANDRPLSVEQEADIMGRGLRAFATEIVEEMHRG